MAEVNPIYDVYNAMWSMYESVTDFTTLFPSNTVHQVRYTHSTSLTYAPDPDQNEAETADYPMCRIVVSKCVPLTERESGRSRLQLVLTTEICTGQQMQNIAHAACWAVFKAHLKWRTYLRDVVTWQSKQCVYDVDARGVEFDDANHERNRGTKQWIPVWTTVVELHFDTSDLQTK